MTDANFEHLRHEMIWNLLAPDRRPRLIVQAANENDVAQAIKFARANRMKVAVRGGGHSWVGFSFRDDSLLIDLGRLSGVSIDRENRLARVQPAVRGCDLDRMLAAQGLAFPVGHCGTVPMSGYLLNGGIGWNYNDWGVACFSIEGAKVVTAAGDTVVAGEGENSDLLWAIRGGGPGFFGVVTEYTLRVYRAPQAVTTSSYFYPLERIEDVGPWAAEVARRMPRHVELTILIAAAPPAIADRCKSTNGFVCAVLGTAFVNSASEAAAGLGPLESCPALSDCLLKELNTPTPIDGLHELGAGLWPERHRYLADTLWTNSPPASVLAAAREHFVRAPSTKSVAVLSFRSGGTHAPLPDAAYSMTADALLLCYAVWERSEDDAANAAWHRAAIAELDRYAVGHYVGESDIVASPIRAERAYAKANWERMQALRRKYDPEGLFHGHFTAPA